MNFLLCTLFVYAPRFLALRAPKNVDGFRRVSEVPATVFSTAAVDEAIQNAPQFVEDAVALRAFMNGSHRIADALHKTTVAPKNITSFLELEGRLASAMERSRAWTEMKNVIGFASKRFDKAKSVKLGINSINIGLARSGAPWYQLMKSVTASDSNFEYFDANDVKLVGAVAFFLNMAYTKSILEKSKSTSSQGKWRMCMAASLSSSVFFKGKFYSDGFSGSDFGGEDFYFAFANSDNVPGWSWSIGFNHDYVASYLGHAVSDRIAAAKNTKKYADMSHLWSHLSRLTGGFEFTAGEPLKQLVAINFGYCIMGRSQGGECADVLDGDDMETKKKNREKAAQEADRVQKLRAAYGGWAQRLLNVKFQHDDVKNKKEAWTALEERALAENKVSREEVQREFPWLIHEQAKQIADQLTAEVQQERESFKKAQIAIAAESLSDAVSPKNERITKKKAEQVITKVLGTDSGQAQQVLVKVSREEIKAIVDLLEERRTGIKKLLEAVPAPDEAEKNAVKDLAEGKEGGDQKITDRIKEILRPAIVHPAVKEFEDLVAKLAGGGTLDGTVEDEFDPDSWAELSQDQQESLTDLYNQMKMEGDNAKDDWKDRVKKRFREVNLQIPEGLVEGLESSSGNIADIDKALASVDGPWSQLTDKQKQEIVNLFGKVQLSSLKERISKLLRFLNFKIPDDLLTALEDLVANLFDGSIKDVSAGIENALTSQSGDKSWTKLTFSQNKQLQLFCEDVKLSRERTMETLQKLKKGFIEKTTIIQTLENRPVIIPVGRIRRVVRDSMESDKEIELKDFPVGLRGEGDEQIRTFKGVVSQIKFLVNFEQTVAEYKQKAVQSPVLGDWKEDDAIKIWDESVEGTWTTEGGNMRRLVRQKMEETQKFGLKGDEGQEFLEAVEEAINTANEEVEGEELTEEAGTPAKVTNEIMSAEKWSKNTVETGVGHCWCSQEFRDIWDVAPFS